MKQLKSELAALDRKITAALAPKKEEQDGEENKQVNTVESPAETKKSMVAEPADIYRQREPLSSRIIIGGCGVTPPGGFRAAGPKL